MTFQRRSHGDFIRSWRELREARRLLSEISAQDEFANWARQQRTVDRLQAQHDRLAGERQRALLAKSVGLSLALRIILYGGLFYYLNVRLLGARIACYSRDLLGPLASVLAMPRCPVGCISPSALFTISTVALNRLTKPLFK